MIHDNLHPIWEPVCSKSYTLHPPYILYFWKCLKIMGSYWYHMIQHLRTLPFTTQTISVPLLIPTVNSVCYLRRHKPVGPICNKHVLCPLSVTSISIFLRISIIRSEKIENILPFSSVSIILSMLHT